MATIYEEELFPAPRDKLWELFFMHLDEAKIKEIHPEVVSDRTVVWEGSLDPSVQGNRKWVVDRVIKFRGKTYKMTWNYSVTVPGRLRYEIAESDGLVSKGSYVENTFVEVPGGTQISTMAVVTVEGIPRFLQRWAAKRLLAQLDKGDVNYFRKIHPQYSKAQRS